MDKRQKIKKDILQCEGCGIIPQLGVNNTLYIMHMGIKRFDLCRTCRDRAIQFIENGLVL